MSLKKPKAPAEDPSTIALRERQVADLSKLDEDENRRLKTLMTATRGSRMFRGSPVTRARPSNTAGTRSGSMFAPPGGGLFAGPGSGGGGGSGSGGGRGGAKYLY